MSRSTSKLQLEDRGSEKRLRAFEDDEWVTLSDPPSDTDEENEEVRVLEGKKSKHVGLNDGKPHNMGSAYQQLTCIPRGKTNVPLHETGRQGGI